jgi:predicted nucleic acid-binding protein
MPSAAERVCLDSWAVLAWLDGDEPAAGRVEETLAMRPVMSWINLGEVYYRVSRDHGTEAAEEVWAQLPRQLTLDEVKPRRVLEAARVKSRHPIAFADCVAIATAVAHGLPLLTGDPELVALAGEFEIEDLRA